MSNTPEESAPTLQQLIARNKGPRTYIALAKDCGGIPTKKTLQQLATQELRTFPTPETIRGLAQGLDVSVSEVVLAVAKTLNLRVYPNDALLLPGAATLEPTTQEIIRGVAREFLRQQTRLRPAPENGKGYMLLGQS